MAEGTPHPNPLPREREQEKARAVASLTDKQRLFLHHARVCKVASVGPRGPHVAPLCHVLLGDTVYVETQPKKLTVRNVATSDQVVVLVDDYAEDWPGIRMLSVEARARTLTEGPEFEKAAAALNAKFPQFADMGLTVAFVLAFDLGRVRNADGV